MKYGLTALKQKILNYIKTHVEDIEHGNAFPNMDFDTFLVIIGETLIRLNVNVSQIVSVSVRASICSK